MKSVELLEKSGLKCTKQRSAVLEVLMKEQTPITAEKIQEKSGVSTATIYRILDLMCEKNLVIKSQLLDNPNHTYELNRNEHKHYAVCMDCKGVTPIDCCHYHSEISDGFQVTGHKIEVYGYCKNCKANHGG